MQRFQTPVLVDEIICEPVEQFRVGRFAATVAEVVWGRNDSLAEMVVPNSIGNDTRRERIFGISKPFGKTLSAHCLRRVRSKTEIAAELWNFRKAAGGNFITGRADVAALE